MKEGDIVLAVMPQDAAQKLRPVLILKILPGYNDLLVCSVSSQLKHYISGFDLLLEKSNASHESTGLITASVFRLTNLAVLERKDIAGAIGYLSADLHQ